MLNKSLQQRKVMLNRIYKQYKIPPEMYVQLLNAIQNELQTDEYDVRNFIDILPSHLQQKLNKLIYSANYKVIGFLNFKPESFINWLCPLLKPCTIEADGFVYLEDESQSQGMYFMTRGKAAYVLPLHEHVAYIRIDEGDDFGQADIMLQSTINDQRIVDLLKDEKLPFRFFSIKTLERSEFLEMDLQTLVEMSDCFVEAFEQIFSEGEYRLGRALNHKLKALRSLI